ncbi:hypothetical protein RHGRI_033906 [Rhododendron griersonianum]|uniref:Uncharacterized protein n=1 Tax=Rhododendron griersonianum TaxID=479676 RepID=A0AAV6HZC3_9ERIC|nr:hypothetical protein RHGRI_033906 [Rhododendron griersonianum]
MEHSTPVSITALKSLEQNGAEDSFEDTRQLEHQMTSCMRKRWETGNECRADVGESIFFLSLVWRCNGQLSDEFIALYVIEFSRGEGPDFWSC